MQYRYIGTAITGSPNPFLDEVNWQGVDAKPTAGSKNFVESVGINNAIKESTIYSETALDISNRRTGRYIDISANSFGQDDDSDVVQYYNIPVGTKLRIKLVNTDNHPILARVANMPELAAGRVVKVLSDIASGVDYFYEIEEGFGNLDMCVDTGTTPVVNVIKTIKQQVNENKVNISENTDGIEIVTKDISNISRKKVSTTRYAGTTGTNYGWRTEVDIPAGAIVRNLGTGNVTLYDVKDYDSPNKIYANAGKTITTTFDCTWVRGRSASNLPFDLIVYADYITFSEIAANKSAINEVGKEIKFKKVSGTGAAYSTIVSIGQDTHMKSGDTVVLSSGSVGVYLNGGDTGKEVIRLSSTSPMVTLAEDVDLVRLGSVGGDYSYSIYAQGLPKRVSDIDNQITTIGNQINTINNQINEQELVSIINNRTNRRFSNTYYLIENNTTDVIQYESLPVGSIVRITLQNDYTSVKGRVVNQTSFNSEMLYEDINIQSGTEYILTIEEGLQYLVLCVNTGTTPSVIVTVDKIDKNANDIEELTEQVGSLNIEQVISSIGEDGLILKANNLDTDIVATDFPYSNKFGDKYGFCCKVSSFIGLKICKGFESYRARWFEIDGTNVVLKSYESSVNTVETVAHGLTITRILNVNINILSDGKAYFRMQTLGGTFEHAFSWGYDANGALRIKNNGSILTDCILSATNGYFKCPAWLFGASYEGVSTARWIGQMKAMGYFNYLLNAYAGRNGTNIIADLNKALLYGTPKYLFVSNYNDGSLNTFITNLNAVKTICDANGITLIVNLRPDSLNQDFSSYRAAVIELGCRYINMENALHDPNKVWSSGTDTWYDGFMSSDGKHPTVAGATAIALQACIDFPEIMQYAKDNAISTTPDYEGGDN